MRHIAQYLPLLGGKISLCCHVGSPCHEMPIVLGAVAEKARRWSATGVLATRHSYAAPNESSEPTFVPVYEASCQRNARPASSFAAKSSTFFMPNKLHNLGGI